MIKLKKIVIDNIKEYVSIKYFDEKQGKNFKFNFTKYKTLEFLLKDEFLKEIKEKIENPMYKKSEAD